MGSWQDIIFKWMGKEYDLKVDMEETSVAELHALVQEKTGIPVDKMKIIGMKQLGHASEVKLADAGVNPRLMVIGTRLGKELVQPKEKTKFIEELTADERYELVHGKKLDTIPMGIRNQGVTCYLNSVVQMLRGCEPLKQRLLEIAGPNKVAPNAGNILSLLAELIKDLEAADSPPEPIALITLIRSKFPVFARKSTSGTGFQQQDAEELLNCIFQTLRNHQVRSTPEAEQDIVDELFGFDVKVHMELDQADAKAEPSDYPEVKTERMYKLCVTIGEVGDPTNFMLQGIERSLVTSVERKIPSSDINAKWKSISRMASIPPYLLTHFIRFEWKKTEEGGTRAKVTRKIAFSRLLDVYTLCTDEQAAELAPLRLLESEAVPHKPRDGIETKNAYDGKYDLVSIVTHEGRTTDSGHYVGWMRKEDDPDMWYKYDDDEVTEHSWNTLDLQGGRSDYHMAFLCLWRRKEEKVELETWNSMKEKNDEEKKKLQDALDSRKNQ